MERTSGRGTNNVLWVGAHEWESEQNRDADQLKKQRPGEWLQPQGMLTLYTSRLQNGVRDENSKVNSSRIRTHWLIILMLACCRRDRDVGSCARVGTDSRTEEQRIHLSHRRTGRLRCASGVPGWVRALIYDSAPIHETNPGKYSPVTKDSCKTAIIITNYTTNFRTTFTTDFATDFTANFTTDFTMHFTTITYSGNKSKREKIGYAKTLNSPLRCKRIPRRSQGAANSAMFLLFKRNFHRMQPITQGRL